jgi:hypothetical protein
MVDMSYRIHVKSLIFVEGFAIATREIVHRINLIAYDTVIQRNHIGGNTIAFLHSTRSKA